MSLFLYLVSLAYYPSLFPIKFDEPKMCSVKTKVLTVFSF